MEEKNSRFSGRIRPLIRTALRYGFRPARFLRGTDPVYTGLSLAGTAAVFGGLFFSVGLDWYHAGLVSSDRMWAYTLMGILTGAVAALLLAAILSFFAASLNKERISPFAFLPCVAGASLFPGCLILFGILWGCVFSTPVSDAFGLAGLLWWLWLIFELMRDLFRKHLLAVLSAVTVYGCLVCLWINVTFGLK